MPATYRRPLHVPLFDDDVLFFQHIPKTGGLSLITLLDAQFKSPQIVPKHSPQDNLPFKELVTKRNHDFRLVRGHFRFGPRDDGVYRYVARNPIWFTFLREPIARTISAYHHRVREGKVSSKVTLWDYVHEPEFEKNVLNVQARMIAGMTHATRLGEWGEPNDFHLHMARENLEFMAFFGLVEQYEKSLQLMCYTFDWPQVESIPHINAAPRPARKDEIEPETMERIREITAVDAHLYAFATTLFEQRYAQMLEEIGVAPDAPPETIHTRLQAVHEERNAGRKLVDLRARVIRVARNAAPAGTRRGHIYEWMRMQLRERAPNLAHAIDPNSKRARRSKRR